MFEYAHEALAAIDELAAIDLSGLSADEQLDLTLAYDQLAAKIAAGRMAAQVAFSATYTSRIGTAPHAEYALAARISDVAAGNDFARADRYATVMRPVRDAMAAGLVGDRHARAIERGCGTALDADEDTVSAIAARAAEYAKTHTPAEVSRTVARWLKTVDPRSAAERYEAAQQQRRLDFWVTEDGLGNLAMSGNPAELYLIYKSVCAAAVFDKSHAEPGDDRTLVQHRADIAVGVLYDAALAPRIDGAEQAIESVLIQQRRSEERSAILGTPLLPMIDAHEVSSWQLHRSRELQRAIYQEYDDLQAQDPARDADLIVERKIRWGPPARGRLRRVGVSPIQISMVTDQTTAAGLAANPVVVDDQFSLPSSVLKRFAGQADFRALLVDRDGGLLATSPHVWVPNRELREFVELRDRVCQEPNCLKPADQCDLDHRVPFNQQDPANGGLTTEANLGPLCRKGHLRKTHGGFQLVDAEDGRSWITPLGRAYTVHVVDLRPGSIPDLELYVHKSDGG